MNKEQDIKMNEQFNVRIEKHSPNKQSYLLYEMLSKTSQFGHNKDIKKKIASSPLCKEL